MKNIDAALHTRGESEYADDLPQPAEMLYAAVYGSPEAHGKVLKLDFSEANKVPGVAAVLTAKDIPGENQIGPIIQDEPLLAKEEVHFAGQPLAVVIASSPQTARKGVGFITAEFEELPIITDPKVAYAKGEIIGTPRTLAIGDVDAAWDKCDLVVEGTCDMGGQEHVYLETHRARAIPLEGNVIRIHASTQSPYACQRAAAKILGVRHHRIEVDVKRIGGGFGGKEDQATPIACMAALGAWYTGKPVELVLNRSEDMRMTGKRHPYISDFKIGATKDGKILAFEVNHYQNSGATADLSTAVLERTLYHSTNSYFIPNARISGACCRTNLPSNTAFRGFGGPQGMFVIECALEKIAEALNKPKEEIQQKNLLKKGDLFPFGQRFQNNHVQRAWKNTLSSYDIEGIRNRIDRFNSEHFGTKKGYAVMPVCFGISFTTTFMNQASALVHVYTDGSVSVTTGGIEMGQGLSTNIVKIATKAFGISSERIKLESTNTTRIANMSPSAASSTTLLNGNATVLAIKQILSRLKSFAVEELNLPDKDSFTISEEKILHNGKDTGMTWNDLVHKAYLSRIGLSAHAFFATPDIWFDKKKERGEPFAYHVVGTAIVEVTLDCLSGTYDIDSVKIVHDLGRPLNRRIDMGQIEGGLAQGLGWVTLEDLQYDEKGQLLSNALANYKVPDVYFMPDDIQVKFLTNADSELGPYGSKAVGEPPLMYGIGAFFALRHAMKAFRPDLEFPPTSPLTPERVLMSLHPEFLEEIKELEFPSHTLTEETV
ncbi:MAG: molybdopterin-dependent oxidoreductase [Candidatus Marinimicrobia bacterium]|nr:molybdopterin-dependent oxidoreductase [Candidatus Neomarinimicrobiota bacterium]